jgi:hypothetical protein
VTGGAGLLGGDEAGEGVETRTCGSVIRQ